MGNPFVHVELMSTDVGKAKAFYGKLFDWKLENGEEWDMPILNVFRRGRDGICHFWGSELLYVPPEPGQEYRHNDLLDPVWNMFDLAPEGRGDFQPKLDYTSGSGK